MEVKVTEKGVALVAKAVPEEKVLEALFRHGVKVESMSHDWTTLYLVPAIRGIGFRVCMLCHWEFCSQGEPYDWWHRTCSGCRFYVDEKVKRETSKIKKRGEEGLVVVDRRKVWNQVRRSGERSRYRGGATEHGIL